MRRAVRGCVERVLRCDVRCGLWRASAGCRAGGLRASCAMRLRILEERAKLSQAACTALWAPANGSRQAS